MRLNKALYELNIKKDDEMTDKRFARLGREMIKASKNVVLICQECHKTELMINTKTDDDLYKGQLVEFTTCADCRE